MALLSSQQYRTKSETNLFPAAAYQPRSLCILTKATCWSQNAIFRDQIVWAVLALVAANRFLTASEGAWTLLSRNNSSAPPVAELPLPGCQTHLSISVHHSWPLAPTNCLNTTQQSLLGYQCRLMYIPGQHLKHSSRDRPQIVAFIAPARQASSRTICWAVLFHLTKTWGKVHPHSPAGAQSSCHSTCLKFASAVRGAGHYT